MNKAAVVLAAGKGKRMKSDLPKVLHKIKGRPMICYLIETLKGLDFDRIVVIVGHKGEMVIEEMKDHDVDFVWQKQQKGTGHAVLMTEELFKDYDGTILVTLGDAPLLTAKSIMTLFEIHTRNNAAATCLSAFVDNPEGYGRIIRKPGTDIVLDIVEDKDADESIKKISEINSGTFCFSCRDLFEALHFVKDDNVQKEYYLTDTIKILQNSGKICAVWAVPDSLEAEGVNDFKQLKDLEKAITEKKY